MCMCDFPGRLQSLSSYVYAFFLGLLDAKFLAVCVRVLFIGLLLSLSLCWRAFNRAATKRLFLG